MCVAGAHLTVVAVLTAPSQSRHRVPQQCVHRYLALRPAKAHSVQGHQILPHLTFATSLGAVWEQFGSRLGAVASFEGVSLQNSLVQVQSSESECAWYAMQCGMQGQGFGLALNMQTYFNRLVAG